MTNIEKWCLEHKVIYYPDLTPCEIIGIQGHCDICPYRIIDENECKLRCNVWGEKEATDD